jgi:hypothetical protein
MLQSHTQGKQTGKELQQNSQPTPETRKKKQTTDVVR